MSRTARESGARARADGGSRGPEPRAPTPNVRAAGRRDSSCARDHDLKIVTGHDQRLLSVPVAALEQLEQGLVKLRLALGVQRSEHLVRWTIVVPEDVDPMLR